jgi:hypothetical protein
MPSRLYSFETLLRLAIDLQDGVGGEHGFVLVPIGPRDGGAAAGASALCEAQEDQEDVVSLPGRVQDRREQAQYGLHEAHANAAGVVVPVSSVHGSFAFLERGTIPEGLSR